MGTALNGNEWILSWASRIRSSGLVRMSEVAAVPHPWIGSESAGCWRDSNVVLHMSSMILTGQQMFPTLDKVRKWGKILRPGIQIQ